MKTFKKAHTADVYAAILESKLAENIQVFQSNDQSPSVVIISGVPITFSEFCTIVMIINSNAKSTLRNHTSLDTRIVEFWEVLGYKGDVIPSTSPNIAHAIAEHMQGCFNRWLKEEDRDIDTPTDHQALMKRVYEMLN